jgi:hypothetical protein
MLSQCLERLRLAQIVAQKITDASTLKGLQDAGKPGVKDLLHQARIDQRISETALYEHITEHGCIR